LPTRRIPRVLTVVLLGSLAACGGGGLPLLPPDPAALRSFHVENSWVCADAVSCQDVYDVVLVENTELTVLVTQVTGPSVVRLAVYGPGQPLGGNNLVTGTPNERQCALANAADSSTVLAAQPGTYRVAITRDWGFSSGATGTYTLDLTADKPLTFASQTVDDQPTQATATQCP
jgi:hypothetical protein